VSVEAPTRPLPERVPVRDDRLSGEGTPDDRAALDAYSSVVSGVAARLAPSVASLRIESDGSRPGGAGSAVVIAPDGLAVTSAHVVRRTDGGRAAFTDGSERAFEVVGSDPLSDLAVVRIHGRATEPTLATAVLGDAEQLLVGQLVVAVGNPLGFAGSVSAGVVSGLGRSLATSSGSATRVIDDVIQTDAALHPGSSGGALADSRARVVGINTAVVGPGIGQGLGLAVPVNAATRQVIGALVRDGRVRRAYLGVGGGTRPLPPSARVDGRAAGIEVTTVVAGAPAGRAGIHAGDVLLSIDGHPVETVSQLQSLMSEQRIGTACEVVLWRDGDVRTVEVVLQELEG
jgi:S1-C subfamily serine protease